MYPSYPPPIPLWAIGMPRRKFVPYFEKHYTTTTTTTTTTAKPAVLDSSCSHLPSSCWNNSPYLPLPLECIGVILNMLTINGWIYDTMIHELYIDICAVSNPSTLQPVMSACSVYPTGNLPLQCIEIIQVKSILLFLRECLKIFSLNLQTLLRRQVPLG